MKIDGVCENRRVGQRVNKEFRRRVFVRENVDSVIRRLDRSVKISLTHGHSRMIHVSNHDWTRKSAPSGVTYLFRL